MFRPDCVWLRRAGRVLRIPQKPACREWGRFRKEQCRREDHPPAPRPCWEAFRIPRVAADLKLLHLAKYHVASLHRKVLHLLRFSPHCHRPNSQNHQSSFFRAVLHDTRPDLFPLPWVRGSRRQSCRQKTFRCIPFRPCQPNQGQPALSADCILVHELTAAHNCQDLHRDGRNHQHLRRMQPLFLAVPYHSYTSSARHLFFALRCHPDIHLRPHLPPWSASHWRLAQYAHFGDR